MQKATRRGAFEEKNDLYVCARVQRVRTWHHAYHHAWSSSSDRRPSNPYTSLNMGLLKAREAARFRLHTTS